MTIRESWVGRAGRGLLLAGLVSTIAGTADARPARPVNRRGFDLFAEAFALFNINRVACGVVNRGAICYDPGTSPIGGGAFWPRGTPDAYIYGSGLQAAGIIAADAGFRWASDTVGAAFYDPSSGPLHGEGLTPVYNSLVPADLAAWPNGAMVRDPALYDAVLLGGKTVSQQDLWWRQWDGDASLLTGREHPMGLMVETRVLGWTYPAGNQDIQYLVFTFYNVSASDPAKYSGLDPAIQGEVSALGAQFAANMKSRLGVADYPAGGYRIDSLYVAFASDMDVGPAATDNFATAILPFNLGLTYIDDFEEEAFTYPGDIFAPPFAAAPGFAAAKYLKSPTIPNTTQQVGLTLFSNTLNPNTCTSGLCDAQNVVQLWRYLSGNISPAAGDNPCSVPNPKVEKVCFLSQTSADARFFQASGPFSLDPGQSATVVVSYIFAPAVASALSGRIGSVNAPGTPATAQQIAANPGANLRFIERAAGWVSQSDANSNGAIDQNEVQTVPASLLNKATVAQTLFDTKFLLPFAPTAPNFYLVPGDNRVTVIWQPSVTETEGDPFYATASNPSSPFYDPNFRREDVEGYRVYRGRTSGDLQLIAQFDYAGTVFEDFTGAFAYGNQCAPELGFVAAASGTLPGGCPVAFDTVGFSVSNDVDLTGDVVQVPRRPVAQGRVELADGTVLIVQADTAVTGGGATFAPLANTGVPFAIIDTTVRNSLTYFYAVTAFDVNSLRSGPTSLESALITKSATPRSTALNQVAGGGLTVELVGRNRVLNTAAAQPTIDPATGTFSGPAPPTTSFRSLGAQLFAEHALKAGAVATITIDSVVPEWYHLATYYLTVAGATTFKTTIGPIGPLGDEDGTVIEGPIAALIPADAALLASRGLEVLPFAGRGEVELRLNPVPWFSKDADWHNTGAGVFFGEPATFSNAGGSRWFTGTNETMANPTLDTLHGQVAGVTAINRPSAFGNVPDDFFRRFDQTTYHVFRAADIRFYWGATPGQVDSVIDLTHNVPVPFSGQNRASYGFRANLPGDADLNYLDFFAGACLPLASNAPPQAGCETRNYTAAAVLDASADCDGDGAGDGPGFGLYVNGEPFIFCTATLPSSTNWTYRSYSGEVTQAGGTYAFAPKAADPAVPGLAYRFTAGAPATFPADAEIDLTRVHTVPDPYYVTNALEATTNRKILKFVNLPSQAIIRIYSVSGVLVNIVTTNDQGGGGETTWDLRNRNNQFVASGVYFFHVETPSGKTHIGRFTVVNFAQ